MAKVELTAAQKAVVGHRGGALLVSAAAGSGKTKVLIDRLLAQVCDTSEEVNLDDFLIITYTKAAAAELRAKIAKELAARLAEQPEHVHLRRQSTRIYLTQISTVHAFCASILREYAHVLDIPADFRVGEEQETSALRRSVFDDLIEEIYTSLSEHPNRRALIDRLGYGRDDGRLYDLVMDVYNASRCRAEPSKWLAQCAQAYDFAEDTAAEETVWGAYLMDALRETLASAEEKLRDALAIMQRDAVLSEVYAPLFAENLRAVCALAQQKTWDAIYENRISGFGRLRPVRKPEDPDCKECVQELRKSALEAIQKAQEAFYAPSARVMRDMKESAPAIWGLLEVAELFAARYAQEKRRRRVFDFSDLEHETLRLLYQKQTDLPSAAAREIARRYREILVDEYQDSNAVQERIFSAVSRGGKNRFMVGDVKQSIYRFRLADPTIFLRKYTQYADYTEAEGDEDCKILLSDNFRSRREILGAVNDVFSLIMCKQAAELDYTPEVALKNGNRSFLDTPQTKVELHCIELENEGEKKPSKAENESAFVAARIDRMLHDGTQIMDGKTLRPVRAGDIVILMRVPGSSAENYVSALARYNIPCISDRGGSILSTTEGEVFSAILHIVDNPHRDIELVTAMASQAFAFTPQELADARSAGTDGADLYDCLCAAREKNVHIAQFLSWLARMRRRACELPLCELMEEILLTTDLDNVYAAMPNGEARAANLLALRQLADDNEAAFGGSLSGFCAFLDRLLENGGVGGGTQSEAATDAVRIMSIHKSKGLEFPIVFLADLSHEFNREDTRSAVLMDDTLLIGSNIVDTASKAYYSGMAHTALSLKAKRQMIAEEMRVLYVAMTRAKEMLIMSYCGARLSSALKKWNKVVTRPLRPDVISSALCMGDWVLMAALCRTEAGELFTRYGDNAAAAVSEIPWKITYSTDGDLRRAAPQKSEICGEKTTDTAFAEEETFSYPYSAATQTASKLTATQLKGRELDFEAAQEAQPLRAEAAEPFRRPQLHAAAKLSGREKGSATHLFMQYVCYEKCTTPEGIAAELERLTNACFLTPEQAQSVNTAQILALFSGEFGRRILTAEAPVREFKFSILTDAGRYVPEAAGEQVMLQGVVDCFWQENGELVIVDFKTDRIRDNLQEKAAQYTPQLEAYALALSRIYAMPVKAKYLYFFDAGKAFEVP